MVDGIVIVKTKSQFGVCFTCHPLSYQRCTRSKVRNKFKSVALSCCWMKVHTSSFEKDVTIEEINSLLLSARSANGNTPVIYSSLNRKFLP